jgi:hypothetical protein
MVAPAWSSSSPNGSRRAVTAVLNREMANELIHQGQLVLHEGGVIDSSV